MNPFERVSLGKLNLVVTRLGLGGGPLAGLFPDVPEDQAVATARRALQAGACARQIACSGCGLVELEQTRLRLHSATFMNWRRTLLRRAD
jgi:hypothetical protein